MCFVAVCYCLEEKLSEGGGGGNLENFFLSKCTIIHLLSTKFNGRRKVTGKIMMWIFFSSNNFMFA
jgi:hypothetical protein